MLQLVAAAECAGNYEHPSPLILRLHRGFSTVAEAAIMPDALN